MEKRAVGRQRTGKMVACHYSKCRKLNYVPKSRLGKRAYYCNRECYSAAVREKNRENTS